MESTSTGSRFLNRVVACWEVDTLLGTRSCLFLAGRSSALSLLLVLAPVKEVECSGNPANTSLGFPLAGVPLSLAIPEVATSVPGGLCISMVVVRERARGGIGWAVGGAGGGDGAEAGSGSLCSAWSSKKEEFCEKIVAELDETASGS